MNQEESLNWKLSFYKRYLVIFTDKNPFHFSKKYQLDLTKMNDCSIIMIYIRNGLVLCQNKSFGIEYEKTSICIQKLFIRYA